MTETPSYRPVPPQVDLPALEREVLEFWHAQRDLREVGRPQRGRRGVSRALDLLRGPAHGERPTRHPPHRVADLQGRLPPVPDHAGLPGQPQGWLGLPRPAGGAGGREGARVLRQAGHRGLRHRRVQRALPRVGAALRRPVGADDRPDGLLDRHAHALPHDGPGVHRVGVVGAEADPPARACSSRTTASRRTAPAAAPASPTTSSPRGTRPSPTPRCTCGSRSPPGPYAGTGDSPGADLLVWTTTPWTLVSNALVAAHPEMTYVTATKDGETLVVAELLVEKALGEGWTIGDRFSGTEMVGWTYQRPFELVEWPARTDGDTTRPDAHFVVTEDYVTAEDGTGLVHQSPAFGEDDFASCRRNGVAMVNPIDRQGHFDDDAGPGRRTVLPARQHRPRRRPVSSAGCCSGTCPTSTATRTAGAVTPHSSTTRSRRGTSAPPR